MRDKEQRHKTGDIGWETKYKDVRGGQRTLDRDGRSQPISKSSWEIC